ncbi:ImmA/IrrE family metallo-endopeptidase [Bradyrhizobium sp. LA6.10]|uniref:ImmA/IrrE family metallo-endopeptidase n=1 Tax=Bradyrhizobium sp. LA6.10 TaxID=3156318 RepID=UPI003393A8EF
MDELTAVLRAREFVNKVAPSVFPVSVKSYAAEIGAAIYVDADMAPYEQGYCVEVRGKFRICVNEKDDETRRRFTVCHEIAHRVLGLPSEHDGVSSWSYAKRSPNEILCDVFAAELLLPYKLFKPMVEKAAIGLSSIYDLAEGCGASRLATASRFATLVRAPCAFVLAEQGKVRYAARSTALREARAWIPLRADLPNASAASRLRADMACSCPEELDADVWFENWSRGGILLEDARHLQKWDQTVALLWFEDEEMPSETTDPRQREEEENGLAELDGILPWPGKKRRK